MEWIYYLSVLVGLIEMLTTDYEELRIEWLRKGTTATEHELITLNFFMSLIPVLNTVKAIKFIYLKITKTNKNG